MRKFCGTYGTGALVLAFFVGLALAMVFPGAAIVLLSAVLLLAVFLLINLLRA